MFSFEVESIVAKVKKSLELPLLIEASLNSSSVFGQNNLLSFDTWNDRQHVVFSHQKGNAGLRWCIE